MTETEFHRAVDAVLARIEVALEAHDELDFDLEGGVLTIECADGTQVIVNRQAPTREIWVAARSGGFHFRSKDGAWLDTRAGTELFASLAAILRAQAGLEVEFT